MTQAVLLRAALQPIPKDFPNPGLRFSMIMLSNIEQRTVTARETAFLNKDTGFSAERTDFRGQQHLSSASWIEETIFAGKGKDYPLGDQGDSPSAGYCLGCVQMPAMTHSWHAPEFM